MIASKLQDFHIFKDVIYRAGYVTARQETQFTYSFENFFHPFVGELIDKLNKESLSGLLDLVFYQIQAAFLSCKSCA
jgi:hypothetical protein